MTGPIEAAAYERRRLRAALLDRTEPPPGVLRPLLAGVLLAAAVALGEVVRRAA